MTAEDLVTLETLIDRYGVQVTLEAFSGICNAKAEHLRINWQDSANAKVWDQIAAKVNKASTLAAL